MLVEMMVPECDFTDQKFPRPVKGGGYIARGATGRWCIVMYAGPKQVETHIASGGKVMTMSEAYNFINELGGDDYPDF